MFKLLVLKKITIIQTFNQYGEDLLGLEKEEEDTQERQEDQEEENMGRAVAEGRPAPLRASLGIHHDLAQAGGDPSWVLGRDKWRCRWDFTGDFQGLPHLSL